MDSGRNTGLLNSFRAPCKVNCSENPGKRKTMRPKVQIISAALFSGAVCDTVPEAHLTMEGDDPTLMCLYFLFHRRALEAL